MLAASGHLDVGREAPTEDRRYWQRGGPQWPLIANKMASSCGCSDRRLGPDMVGFKPVLEAFLLFEAGMDGSDFVDAVSGPDLRVSSLGRPICCSECQIDILLTFLASCSSRLLPLLVCYP